MHNRTPTDDARHRPGRQQQPQHEAVSPAVRHLGEETRFLFWTATPTHDRVLFASPAYERIFGRPRDELYADPWAFIDLVHPEDRPRLLATDFSEVNRDIVYRVVRPDGSDRVVRTCAIPVRDETGAVRELLGLTEDVTDAHRTAEDLARRNRVLAALHAITRATFGVRSPGAMAREIAGHVAAATGFPIVVIERYDPRRDTVVLEGAAGLTGASTDPPPERPAAGSLAGAVTRDGTPVAVQAPSRWTDGEALYGTRVGTLVAVPTTSGGRPTGAVTIAHPDVVPLPPALVEFVETLGNHLAAVLERRRTEDALRASEHLFHRVAEHVTQAIILIDVRTGDVKYVSPAWMRIFQRDPAALAGGVAAALPWVHPDDRARIGRLCDLSEGTMTAAVETPLELRILRPDGSVRWLRARGSRLRDAHGVVTHVLGIAEDITGEVERMTVLEDAVARATTRVRELERQRAAQDRLALVGRMAARIAHEINNPLAGVKNVLFLLREAAVERPEFATWLDRAHREIDRIARIVRQMYELYRPEAEGPRAHVAGSVASGVALLLPDALERGVTVSVDGLDQAHTAALPDSALRELVAALLHNAIEASPAGGTVRVGARVADDVVELTVSDEGPGIPAALRPRVFEPFFTTKTARAVRGFGLTLVKNIADALGGTVALEDAPSGGACVRVRLPAAEPGL